MKTFKEYLAEAVSSGRQRILHSISSERKLDEQNDNPDPEDIRTAIIASRRKLMSAKSVDEKKFYRKKIAALRKEKPKNEKD